MRPLISICSLFAILLFTPNFLRAITFVGGFENNTWTDPRNWSPQQIPAAGDLAVIPDDRTAVLFSTVSVDQLILEGSLTNGGGGSLTIVSSFNCTNAGFSAPITTSNGCAILWVGGVGVGADFTNYGDVSCNANVSLDHSKIINHGTFDDNGTFSMGAIHSPTSFENYGLLRKPLLNGGTTFSLGTLVTNFAGCEIEVNSGEIYLSLTSKHYGDVQVDAGATLRTHAMELYDGSAYAGDGTLNITGNGTFANNSMPLSIDILNSTVNSNGVFGSGTLNFTKTVDERRLAGRKLF